MDFIDRVILFWNNLSSSEVISYGIGLAGILISIIIYLRSKRIQMPRYKKMSAIITEEFFSKNSNVHIQNGEEKLKILTVSKIAFWNEGITLKKEDISTKSPFRIELTQKDAQILETYVSYAQEENDVSCDITDKGKKINIYFDYLAKNQGFILKVLHTGGGSNSLSVKGTIRNTGKLKHSESLFFKLSTKIFKIMPLYKMAVIYAYIFILVGVIMILKGVFSYGIFVEAHIVPLKYTAFYICSGVLSLILGYYMQKGKMPGKISKAFYNEL